jgi:hypothetical protein
MRDFLMIGLVVFLTGCKVGETNDLKVGRYTLTASSNSVSMYRLDTATGELDWCRPIGTPQEGYKLECVRETR